MHRPMEVENVEIERMRLHMERDGKGEMNCWAALGTVRKSTIRKGVGGLWLEKVHMWRRLS